jgi:Mg-chelatase subunit ChlD
MSCSLNAVMPLIGTSDSTPCAITVASLDYACKILPLKIFEHYKTDFTSSIDARLTMGGQVMDEANFQVHIPASPYSSAGLSVVVDSFFQTGTTRNVTFSVQKNVDSSFLLNLSKTNVFVYENGVSPDNISLGKDTTKGNSAVDIVFVLDVTGSMGGEIAGVQANIVQFANALSKKGIDFRLGMVTFLDYVENVYAFTNNVQTFQGYVLAQSAHGGDDSPENSLKALDTASHMPFRPNAKIKFIWITDAPYHTQGDGTAFTTLTAAPVLKRLLSKGITVFSIGPVEYQTQWYMPLYDPTGGRFYDINGNFQDILMDIADMNSSKNYLVSYTLPTAFDAGRSSIVLEIHAQGLGVKDTVRSMPGLGKRATEGRNALRVDYKAGTREILISSANSFSPIIVTICDLRGKTVLSENLSAQQVSRPIALTRFKRIGTGVYLITISSMNYLSNAKTSITRRINIL